MGSCKKCNGSLGAAGGAYIETPLGNYHERCFSCHLCGDSLVSKKSCKVDGKPTCTECSAKSKFIQDFGRSSSGSASPARVTTEHVSTTKISPGAREAFAAARSSPGRSGSPAPPHSTPAASGRVSSDHALRPTSSAAPHSPLPSSGSSGRSSHSSATPSPLRPHGGSSPGPLIKPTSTSSASSSHTPMKKPPSASPVASGSPKGKSCRHCGGSVANLPPTAKFCCHCGKQL